MLTSLNLLAFPSVGPMELVIVLLIVLVLFGPKALPQLGRALGSGIREFKDATSKLNDEIEDGSKTEAENKAKTKSKS